MGRKQRTNGTAIIDEAGLSRPEDSVQYVYKDDIDICIYIYISIKNIKYIIYRF